MKPLEKRRARELRKLGYSLRDISEEIGVAKSTASLWTKDISLSPDQKHKLWLRLSENVSSAQSAWVDKNRSLRLEYQNFGKDLAKNNDPFFWSCCALYWGEGTKKRNTATFTNSDVDMLRVFVLFLRKYFRVSDTSFVLRLSLYEGNGVSMEDAKLFWQDTLSLPECCWRKCVVLSSKKTKCKNVIKYGTLSVSVHDTSIVQAIYGALQHMYGFTRDSWLD